MPLSDREQHLLEQMELALSSEDPRFANQMRSGATRARRRDWILGGVGVVVGLAVVLLGVTMRNMWVGGIGFAIMVAAVVFVVTPRKRPALSAVRPDGSTAPRRPASGKTRGNAGFMQRLEERWDRRRDQGW